jgi:hypothetical protein
MSGDWDGGAMRAHHIWWFERLPKVTGETDRTFGKRPVDENGAPQEARQTS